MIRHSRMELDQMDADTLQRVWAQAKEDEKVAQAQRRLVEGVIIEKAPIKEHGTTDLGLLKVSRGVTRVYESKDVERIRHQLPDNVFPFKTEYKPDARAIKALEKLDPEAYAIIDSIAIEKPKAPYFSVKKDA